MILLKHDITKIFLVIIFFAISNSCNKSTDFDTKIYFAQAAKTNILPLTIDNGKGVLGLSLLATDIISDDVQAEIEILEDKYLEDYNKKSLTNYVPIPKSAISFESNKFNISKGKATSDNFLNLTVKDWVGYVDGAQYALPVRLVSKTGAQVLPGADVIIVAVNKVIQTVAANTTSGFSVSAEEVYGKGKAVNNITVEGKFLLTRNFIVPGNWRSDIFYGFGMQFVVFDKGGMDVRLPNSAFIFAEKPPLATTLNTWTHFALTYKDSQVTLFVNGEQVGSSYKYSDLPLNGLDFGTYTNGVNLSEFRIWDHVRSRQQLKTFACAVDPSTEGLLGYWRFNEGTGNVVKDSSKGNHNLRANGAVNWVTGVKCP